MDGYYRSAAFYGAYAPTYALDRGYVVDVPQNAPYYIRPRYGAPLPRRAKNSQSLRPRKKDFKPSKKGANGKKSATPTNAKSLIGETKELHALFRKGPKADDAVPKLASGQKKRKAVTENKRSGKPEKDPNKDEADSKNVPIVMTDEEKEEVEAALVVQRAVCKGIDELFGLEPARGKKANEDPAQGIEEAKAEALTPEEEKQREEKGLEFFSNLLESNQDLRKMYIDKYDQGFFECLICHSVEGRPTKKFSNLQSMVRHAQNVRKQCPQHRAFSRAICSVLQWDPLKLPKASGAKRAFFEEPDEVVYKRGPWKQGGREVSKLGEEVTGVDSTQIAAVQDGNEANKEVEVAKEEEEREQEA